MKNELIQQVRHLLDPRPDFVVFRHTDLEDRGKTSTPEGMFEHEGKLLTRQTMPADSGEETHFHHP